QFNAILLKVAPICPGSAGYPRSADYESRANLRDGGVWKGGIIYEKPCISVARGGHDRVRLGPFSCDLCSGVCPREEGREEGRREEKERGQERRREEVRREEEDRGQEGRRVGVLALDTCQHSRAGSSPPGFFVPTLLSLLASDWHIDDGIARAAMLVTRPNYC